MKFLKGLLIVVVVLVLVFYIGGMFLSKTYSISQSIIINKPDSAVFKTVADFNQFAKWNPWFEKEPTAQSKIDGAAGTVGSSIYWNGKKIGEGRMEISSVDPQKALLEKLTFIQPYQSECDNNFFFAPDGAGTKVTWTMDGVNETTAQRWMILVFKGSITDDFTHGLAKLKQHCESM